MNLRTLSRLAALSLLPALAGCGDSAPPGPNVLLLTLDTTRPDRLGCYGRPDARTPLLDRLARRGALVEWAIADVPVTLPSHTTIMTGVPALAHGVRYNADFQVTEDAETLAEEFTRLGYATGAVISALVLDSKFGIAQGFGFFEDDLTPGYVKYDESLYPKETAWLPKADRRAPETVDRSLRWLEEAERPFFLWSHFYDPHFPFDPPRPWPDTAPELYLAEIHSVDFELRRLVRHLEDSGDMQNTVVVVTSDHGEGLDQHREDGHGIFVYDDTIRVPLIVSGPGGWPAGAVIGEQVRTIDIAPTVLEAAGQAGLTLGTGGSLLPMLSGTGAPPDTVAYSESIKTQLFYGGTGLKAVRTKHGKYVWAPEPELYGLDRDPGETRNVAARLPETGAWHDLLAGTVRDILGSGLFSAAAFDPDAETAEALRSLGYLSGSGADVQPQTFEQEMELRGHDPKRVVDVSMAAREIQNGFYASGERKLLRFFGSMPSPAEDPRMARLWAAAHQNYAKIWMIRGDYARAAEEYRRAAESDPDYDLARWSRIYALNLAREHDRADREAQALLERYPQSYRVMVHRGLALAFQGRRDEAQEQLEVVAREADRRGDASRNARYYLLKLGTEEEAGALQDYLRAEEK